VRRALALGALALAGCGGGGGGNKAVYVRDGDNVCARYQAAIGGLGQPTTLKEIGPYITKALPVLSKTVGELGRLKPPSELSGQFGKFFDHARQTLVRARALRSAAAKADATEVQRLLAEAAKASGARVKLATDAGLKTCAQV
jgi:hypothetical protein